MKHEHDTGYVRDALVERMQPIVDAFTAALVAILTKHIDAQVATARAAALKALRATMEDDGDEKAGNEERRATRADVSRPARRRKPRVRVARSRSGASGGDRGKSRSSKPATVLRDKPPTAKHACKACGQPGHNARTCGRQEPPRVDRKARAATLRDRVQARKSVAKALAPDLDDEDEEGEPEVFADGFRPTKYRDDDPPPAGLVKAALRGVGSELEVDRG